MGGAAEALILAVRRLRKGASPSADQSRFNGCNRRTRPWGSCDAILARHVGSRAAMALMRCVTRRSLIPLWMGWEAFLCASEGAADRALRKSTSVQHRDG